MLHRIQNAASLVIVFGLWGLWRKTTVLILSCQGHLLATRLVTVTSVAYPDVVMRVRFVLCEVPLYLPFPTVPLGRKWP